MSLPDFFLDGRCRELTPEQADKQFFGGTGRGSKTKRAKTLCQNCPISVLCLDYALDNKIPYGVWGGLDERERKQMLANRGITLDAWLAEANEVEQHTRKPRVKVRVVRTIISSQNLISEADPYSDDYEPSRADIEKAANLLAEIDGLIYD